MRSNRKQERFIRRLETEFSSGDKKYRGISRDLSAKGLFLRTSHPFAPGSIIDLLIHLPDGVTSKLKGKVMRAFNIPMLPIKNGMGIYILEKDSHYINFLKTYDPEIQDEPTAEPHETDTKPDDIKADKTPESPPADFLLLKCSKCGIKNKVLRPKIPLGPKCGKCGSPLAINLA